MFRQGTIRSLVLAALVVGVAVAVPLTALAATKPAKPMITKLSLTSVKPGEKFVIHGRNFVHVTAVKVDNIRAKYKVDSATKITATVPKGAKTGKVEVITKTGAASSRHMLKVT
jgi:xanthosine utilization system XapX-like protein